MGLITVPRFFNELNSMADLDEMLDSVRKIDLRLEIPVIIENTKETILLLNAGQLYQLNVDGSGNYIKPRYSSIWYERLKMKMNFNLRPDKVDLYYTGEFYNSRDLLVSKKEYIIFSNDQKSTDLLAKYGNKILELTEESEKEYSEGIFIENIKLYVETVSILKFT